MMISCVTCKSIMQIDNRIRPLFLPWSSRRRLWRVSGGNPSWWPVRRNVGQRLYPTFRPSRPRGRSRCWRQLVRQPSSLGRLKDTRRRVRCVPQEPGRVGSIRHLGGRSRRGHRRVVLKSVRVRGSLAALAADAGLSGILFQPAWVRMAAPLVRSMGSGQGVLQSG